MTLVTTPKNIRIEGKANPRASQKRPDDPPFKKRGGIALQHDPSFAI